ncbi:hypothetical protein [Paenibacillus soyae]|uniref:Uncharacterized protein n=1 Tax=Paenibacillus soyae TaxID=2969249 RepID=A0A9X2MX07_9BACL|nr:hypothetical protein [Paenibacillus soyae]MCR2807985.1 hypothetical protein [Paenibacillus soyae]
MNSQNWERIRSKGKLRYVLKYGMLYFGLPLGIMASLVQRLIRNSFSFDSFLTMELIGDLIGRGLFYMVFAGGIYGTFSWNSYEKKFRERAYSAREYE